MMRCFSNIGISFLTDWMFFGFSLFRNVIIIMTSYLIMSARVPFGGAIYCTCLLIREWLRLSYKMAEPAISGKMFGTVKLVNSTSQSFSPMRKEVQSPFRKLRHKTISGISFSYPFQPLLSRNTPSLHFSWIKLRFQRYRMSGHMFGALLSSHLRGLISIYLVTLIHLRSSSGFGKVFVIPNTRCSFHLLVIVKGSFEYQQHPSAPTYAFTLLQLCPMCAG